MTSVRKEARIIPPLPVAEAQILSTNLVETVPLWVSSKSYALKEEARSGNSIWVSKIPNNSGNDPATALGRQQWILKGPINKLAMFDHAHGTRATRDQNINFSIRSDGWVDSVFLDALTGTEVTISAISGNLPRTNHLLYSRQIDNAAWTKVNIKPFGAGSEIDAQLAADGSRTADKVVTNGTFGQHYFSQTVTTAPGDVWYLSHEVKPFLMVGDNAAAYVILELDDGTSKLRRRWRTFNGNLSTEPDRPEAGPATDGAWSDVEAGFTVSNSVGGNAWTRLWLKGRMNAGTALTVTVYILRAIGDDDDPDELFYSTPGFGHYAGCTQLEKNNLTAPITTAAAPVTVAGDEVYRQTHSLLDDTRIIDPLWDYFYEPLAYRQDLVVTDIELYSDLVITVDINGPGPVACGTFVHGLSQEIGGAVYGARTGITDYSRKETDEFGTYFLTERGFAKRGTFPMFVEKNRSDGLSNTFAQYRAKPVVWLMSAASRSQIFGIYKSFEFVFAHRNFDEYDLVIEGLT